MGKIAIDSTPLSLTRAGIGYYAFELCQNLPACDLENRYFLFTHNKDTLVEFNFPENVEVIEIKSKKPGLLWITRSALWARKHKVNFLISPSNLIFSVLFPKTLQVIHDLTPITHPEFFTFKSRMLFKILSFLAVRFSKAIITVSETSRKEIIRLLKCKEEKVFNFYNGLNSWVYKEGADWKEVKKKYKISGKYFLSVGTVEPRKNYEATIRAFAKFLKDFPDFNYIIIGKRGWLFNNIFKTVKEMDIANRVRFLGYIEDKELKAFYQNASAIVMCSNFEGFGLPAIEAYSLKRPIVLSKIPVFLELNLPNFVFSKSLEPNDITDAMLNVVENPPLTAFPNEAIIDYNWQRISEKYIKLFKDLNL